MSEDILAAIDSTLADVTLCFCGCKKALRATSSSVWFASEECQVRWNTRLIRDKGGIGKVGERVEAAAEPTLTIAQVFAPVTRCWRCGRPAGAALLGEPCPECQPPGTAPTPGVDRVHDAFRAEVIRQGLSEYWVDGVPYVIEGFREAPADPWTIGPRPFLGAALDAVRDDFADRVSAALDAALEPRSRPRRARTIMLAWWRRMLPGGKR